MNSDERYSLDGVPEDDAVALKALAVVLTERGLEVTALRGGMLLASNEALTAESIQGKALSPGLKQIIAVRPHNDGTSWWYWCWSGPARGTPPELEPMCAASNLAAAAERIARVLALRLDEPAG